MADTTESKRVVNVSQGTSRDSAPTNTVSNDSVGACDRSKPAASPLGDGCAENKTLSSNKCCRTTTDKRGTPEIVSTVGIVRRGWIRALLAHVSQDERMASAVQWTVVNSAATSSKKAVAAAAKHPMTTQELSCFLEKHEWRHPLWAKDDKNYDQQCWHKEIKQLVHDKCLPLLNENKLSQPLQALLQMMSSPPPRVTIKIALNVQFNVDLQLVWSDAMNRVVVDKVTFPESPLTSVTVEHSAVIQLS